MRRLWNTFALGAAFALALGAACTTFTSEPAIIGSEAGVDAEGGVADAPSGGEGGGDGGGGDAKTPYLHSAFAMRLVDGGFAESPYVAVPSTFTIEAWVRPTGVPGPEEAAIVADDQSGVAANQLRLGMLATGKVFFTMTDAQGSDHGLRTGSAYNLVSSRSLIPGGWTHVAVVQDGKDFTLFLDAVESRRLTLEPFTRGTFPALPLRLGSRFAPVDDSIAFEPFAGDLDEVRIWKVARTAAQLAASRRQGLAESDYPDLLRYFRLEAGKGTADRDAVTDAGLALQPGATWVTTTPF